MPQIPDTFRDSSGSRNTRVVFAGTRLNLHAVARHLKMDHSYLSRILAGSRTPNLPLAMKIAGALGMTMEDWLSEVDRRRRLLKRRQRSLSQRASAL